MEKLGINEGWKSSNKSEEKLLALLEQKHALCEQLNEKNSSLEKKLEILEKSLKDKMANNKTEDYWTDDEQLSNETEWIRVKNSKKRRITKSATPPTPENLRVKNPKDDKLPKKEPPPPPIIISSVNNFDVLHADLLKAVKKEDFKLKVLKNNGAKLNPTSAAAHRLITAELNNSNLAWHSFENKQSRPFRVMVKGLHHTLKPADIVENLKSQGLQAIDAINKIGWKSKNPLDMFIVSFTCEEDQTKIHNIKYILNMRVAVETLHASKLIPQCKRCQGYGHTQKYCAREIRCVKCVGTHLTADCDRPKESKPKCCHCGDEHPANYRGCLIAKELQKIKDKQNDNKNKVTSPKSDNNKHLQKIEHKRNPIKVYTSYSNAVKGIDKNEKQIQESSLGQTLENILKKLTSFDERLRKIEDITKGTIPKQQKRHE